MFNTIKALSDACKVYGVNIDSLLSDTNPKIKKSADKTFIMHLKPGRDVCPKMGLCESVCLDKAGNPAYKTAKEIARIARNRLLAENPQLFWSAVAVCMARINRRYTGCSFRLNGTSDLVIESKKHALLMDTQTASLLARYGITHVQVGERYTIPELFPENVLYDYTKIIARLKRELPANYHLTFSLDGNRNTDEAIWALENGHNVAVPFFDVPEQFKIGTKVFPVIDGDSSDERYKDKPQSGAIVGLKYKRITNGEVFKNNGFVIASDSV